METLNAEQTRDRLDYPGLAHAIEDILSDDSALSPVRTSMPLPAGGTLLLMPAADSSIAVTKLVTVHPGNADRSLPVIQGEMIVMDSATGTRRGMLDGAIISGRRTAAVSLLAAQHLAPQPHAPLLIVGAGVQARTHLDAFHDGLGTDTVFITSRTHDKADALVAYARERGLTAHVVDQPADAIDQVGLIATTTTSTTPVLPDKLPSQTFVAAVGAFNPSMTELSPTLIAESHVVVDTLAGARAEAGDLIQAVDAGRFDWERTHELVDVIKAPFTATSASILFKSVGTPLWDLAAARYLFRSA